MLTNTKGGARGQKATRKKTRKKEKKTHQTNEVKPGWARHPTGWVTRLDLTAGWVTRNQRTRSPKERWRPETQPTRKPKTRKKSGETYQKNSRETGKPHQNDRASGHTLPRQ